VVVLNLNRSVLGKLFVHQNYSSCLPVVSLHLLNVTCGRVVFQWNPLDYISELYERELASRTTPPPFQTFNDVERSRSRGPVPQSYI